MPGNPRPGATASAFHARAISSSTAPRTAIRSNAGCAASKWSPSSGIRGFADLPADIKRANALIHFGLARAADETRGARLARRVRLVPAPREHRRDGGGAIDRVPRLQGALTTCSMRSSGCPRIAADCAPGSATSSAASTALASDRPELRIDFGDRPLVSTGEETTAAFVAFSAQGLVARRLSAASARARNRPCSRALSISAWRRGAAFSATSARTRPRAGAGRTPRTAPTRC